MRRRNAATIIRSAVLPRITHVFPALLVMKPGRTRVLLLFTLISLQHLNPVRAISCSPGEFACGREPVCVPQRFQCDRKLDCPNGDDEKNCTNEAGSIQLFNTEYIHEPHENWFNRCEIPFYPSTCVCRASTWIYCLNQDLKTIPQNITSNITRLNLVNNSISSLRVEDINRYSSLNWLCLDQNRIERLTSGIFLNLNNLTHLYFSENKISVIENGAFLGLNNLIKLNIEMNFLQDININLFLDTPNLEWLDLNTNFLTLNQVQFPPLHNLDWLNLRGNKITHVYRRTFGSLIYLSVLSLKENDIIFIEDDAFADLEYLIDLDLSNNQIIFLGSRIFTGLINLNKLSLGYNPFNILHQGTFNPMSSSLTSLSLQEIEIANINVSLFSSLTELRFVDLKKFHYCSYLPHVRVCTPNTDGVSSMDNLLGRPILRLCIWLVGIFTCLGNVVVLWGRMTSRDENKVLSLFIRNLAAADLLMGVYLFVIGGHDLFYRDEYYRNARSWMSSWRCTLCGAVAMTSSEASVLILTYMSLERFIYIVCPFGGQSQLKMKTALSSLVVIWTIGLILAFIPIIQWQEKHANTFYGSNGMCFPLHIDDPFCLGWEYSAFIFLGINGLGVVVIITVYVAMFVSIMQTGKKTSRVSMDLEFAKRFCLIVFTDCACWIPIIFLKIAALYSATIPNDLYAWVVVFILPINSAINPIAYTFTTSKFRSRFKKIFWVQPVVQWIGQRKDSADTDSTSASSKRSSHTHKVAPGLRTDVTHFNYPALNDVVNGNANYTYKTILHLESIESSI